MVTFCKFSRNSIFTTQATKPNSSQNFRSVGIHKEKTSAEKCVHSVYSFGIKELLHAKGRGVKPSLIDL